MIAKQLNKIAIAEQQLKISVQRATRNINIFRALGITEILIGAFSIILALIIVIITTLEEEVYNDRKHFNTSEYQLVTSKNDEGYIDWKMAYSLHGVWCGTFVITSGIFGVIAGKSATRWMYVANIVVTICTSRVSLAGMIMSVYAAHESPFPSALFVLHGAIAVLAILSLSALITHCLFCCKALCFSTSRNKSALYERDERLPVSFPTQHIKLEKSEQANMVWKEQPILPEFTTRLCSQAKNGLPTYEQATFNSLH